MNEWRDDITLVQLQAFVAVARLEHVTKAAQGLGVTQPAVSNQLRALEKSLGLPLFEKIGRRLRLTTSGKAVLPAATAALSAVRAMSEVADAHRGLQQGSLSIAASNTVGVYRLPGWLAPFANSYPACDIQIRLVNSQHATDLLLAGEVDCALVEGPCTAPKMEEIFVDWDELVLVASSDHPLSKLPRVRRSDLLGYRYLARESGSATEALAPALLGSLYRQGPVLEMDNVDAVRSGVLAGLGYAVLPTVAVELDLKDGRLSPLVVPKPTLRRKLRALRRPQGHSPTLETFWKHLCQLSSG